MGLLGATAREGLRRIAEDAYSGKTYVTILCNTNGDTSYTAESSISDWETIEISGNGYSRSNYLLQDVGSPSLTDGTCLAAEISADFSATGGSYTYDSLVVFEQSALYPVSVSTISPANSLGDGESVSYRIDIKLSQVDFPLQIEAPEDPFFSQTRVYITFEEGGEGSSFASGATD